MGTRLWAGVWLTSALAWSQGSGNEPQLEITRLIDQGYYSQAEAVARRVLSELDRNDPRGTLETARALDLLANALIRQSADLPRVREPIDRAIAVKSRMLGGEHPSIGVSMALLAEQNYWQGDYPAAIAMFERALAMAEKPPGVTPLEIAEILYSMGAAVSGAGQPKRAQALHERALEIRQRELGSDSLAVAEVLNGLAIDHWTGGDLKGGKTYVERAIAILERIVAADHPSRAYAYATLAGVLKTEGDYTGAIPLYERAIAALESRLGADSPRLATQFSNLALCLKQVDRWDEAAAMLERALRIFEKKYGPDHPRTGVVLANLGIVYKETGDFTRAREAYERALAVQEKSLGPNNEHVGSALHSLGSLLHEMRDYPAARQYLTRALAIHENALGRDSPLALQDMQNLARVLKETGDRSGAMRLYQEVATRAERTLGPANPLLALALVNLGTVSQLDGDYENARKQFRRALEIQQKSYGETHHHTAETLAHLGGVAADEGNWAEAAEYHERAVATFIKAYGGRNYAMAGGMASLAEDLGHLGRQAEALSHALEAAEIRRDHVQLTIRALPERQALLVAAEGNRGLDLALSLAADGKGLPETGLRDVWDALIRDRALVLDELAARHRAVNRSAGPEVMRLTQDLGERREHLARMVVQGPPAGPAKAYVSRLEQARKDVESAEKALAAKALDFGRDLDARRQGYADVAAALPQQGALIAFARYRRQQFGPGPAKETESYLALVLKSGDPRPVLVPLGTAHGVERLAGNWRREIHREAESMGRNAQWNEREYRKAGVALRAAVWDPVAAHVRGIRSVYVVPDGALLLVNLNTLPTGERQYLAEQGPMLHTLSTERDMTEAPAVRHTRGLLAMGNPAFDSTGAAGSAPLSSAVLRGARSRCPDFTSMRFEPLPGSAREVRAIAGIWTGQKEDAMVLTGREATEAGLKQNAAGKRVIHLATHGFFLEQGCHGDRAIEENPLLRAGLALAGANQRKSAGEGVEDGILTAEEVASLNLAGVEWVVLSGCDTGEGEVRAGEGVLGLRRAFRVAGAGTLIASLWPVQDEAARAWMTDLYRSRFGRGRSTAESVTHASVSQLRERRGKGLSTHPFYWGSFVAVGD